MLYKCSHPEIGRRKSFAPTPDIENNARQIGDSLLQPSLNFRGKFTITTITIATTNNAGWMIAFRRKLTITNTPTTTNMSTNITISIANIARG